MRTTLSIDRDVLIAAKEIGRREHRTAGEVISDLAREALNRPRPGTSHDEAFFGFRPLRADGRTVSNALIDRLREDDTV